MSLKDVIEANAGAAGKLSYCTCGMTDEGCQKWCSQRCGCQASQHEYADMELRMADSTSTSAIRFDIPAGQSFTTDANDDFDAIADTIETALGTTEDVTHDFIKLVLGDIALFDRKQRDYGPGNIAITGEKGIVVRMCDKVMRLKNLVLDHPEREASNESIDDTWADSAVYPTIARLVRLGLWK